jgi:hypothetical protein
MNVEEFRATLEYGERRKLIKLILTIAISYFSVFTVAGLVAFFLLFQYSLTIALEVSLSIVAVFYAIDLIFVFYYIHLKNELRRTAESLSDMYIFPYKLGSPIDHKGRQSRYLIKFEYKNKEYELLSSWMYDSNDLDYKYVQIGYAENLDTVMILEVK